VAGRTHSQLHLGQIKQLLPEFGGKYFIPAEMIETGKPCNLYTSSKNNLATEATV
jgi:hypothetical protein